MFGEAATMAKKAAEGFEGDAKSAKEIIKRYREADEEVTPAAWSPAASPAGQGSSDIGGQDQDRSEHEGEYEGGGW